MMRIVIETVDHKDQRYDTVGDWLTNMVVCFTHPVGPDTKKVTWDQVDLLIRVSRMKDWRSEALVAVHELVEALLCKQAGITQEQVDAWDLPRSVSRGEPLDFDEPGNDPGAPYCFQHKQAEIIEQTLAMWLSLKWQDHETNVQTCWEQERAPLADMNNPAMNQRCVSIGRMVAEDQRLERAYPPGPPPALDAPYGGHHPAYGAASAMAAAGRPAHKLPGAFVRNLAAEVQDPDSAVPVALPQCPDCGAFVDNVFDHVDGCPEHMRCPPQGET